MMEDKDMKWKTLEQRYIIKRPWLTARVDKVELPTGVVYNGFAISFIPLPADTKNNIV